MPNYRRIFRAGGTFFLTIVTHHRARILCEPAAREYLREALRECRHRWAFALDAIVLLPDHIHMIWTLPEGDSWYSRRIAFMKRSFTQQWLASGHAEGVVTVGQLQQRRRGVFQPRFWEHTVRDEEDLERRLNYIHYNPVKHGCCERVREWPYSSFQRYVRRGVYPVDWRCTEEMIDEGQWRAIGETAGE